jgi:transcriptional regulator with XRE-family HTH domain
MYSFVFMINEFLLNEFGERIKQLRLQKNISQEKLSFLTGFHRTYIGMIERGERNISLLNMAVFAKVFEINVSELLDFKTVNSNHDFKNYETKTEK